MRTLTLIGVLVAIATTLHAQSTGRTMQVLAPTVLGQTARLGVTYPWTAAGNPYAFLWCQPPFAGTQAISVPGFTVQGLLRVDPASSVAAFSGVLGPTGMVSHQLVIPNHPSFLGMAWDLQSVDLSVGTATVSLADNDLPLVVIDGLPPQRNMVWVSTGTFWMGSSVTPFGVPPYYNEPTSFPVHAVTITRPFWIGKYEVTQAEYQALMGNNPSYFQGAAYPNAAQRPVEQVSWVDASNYCTALTAQEQAAGRLPAGYAYRLPTEAEWEYCCRAGTSTEFHFGPTVVCAQANCSSASHSNTSCWLGQTLVVGSYAPNGWGLHDMHGNVNEWCLDSWNFNANYTPSPVSDPLMTSGPFKVIRGGCFYLDGTSCRSAYRGGYLPWAAGDNGIGFRVVCASVR